MVTINKGVLIPIMFMVVVAITIVTVLTIFKTVKINVVMVTDLNIDDLIEMKIEVVKMAVVGLKDTEVTIWEVLKEPTIHIVPKMVMDNNFKMDLRYIYFNCMFSFR